MISSCLNRNNHGRPQKFSREATSTFCLIFRNCWRCDANGRQQNILPFLHPKDNAPCSWAFASVTINLSKYKLMIIWLFYFTLTLLCHGVWPPLRPVSVAQKNKPSTTLSSKVQSIDLPMNCMAGRFWMMKQPNCCSTSAQRSSAAKQWFYQLAQKKELRSRALCYRPYTTSIRHW